MARIGNNQLKIRMNVNKENMISKRRLKNRSSTLSKGIALSEITGIDPKFAIETGDEKL